MRSFLSAILSVFQLISVSPRTIPATSEIKTFNIATEHNEDIYSIPSSGNGEVEYVEIHSDEDGLITATIELHYIIE